MHWSAPKNSSQFEKESATPIWLRVRRRTADVGRRLVLAQTFIDHLAQRVAAGPGQVPTSRPVRGRSGRMVVSRRRAERRLRSLGRVGRQLTTRTSCSPKLDRPLTGAADCPDPPPITTASGDVRQRLSEVQKRPRRPRNLHRGKGIRVHRRVPTAGPPAHLHRYGRGGHDPLSLLRDAFSAWILD